MRSIAVQFNDMPGHYVLGMAWRHEGKKPSKGRLRELAQSEGHWGLVRKTTEGAYQAGFCEPLQGVAKAGKVKSLADAIASTAKAPWRGAFEMDDGLFWYVAVSDVYELLRDGDRICTAEQLAALQEEHKGFFNWREITGNYSKLTELVIASEDNEALRDFSSRMGDRFSIKPKSALILGAVVILASAGIATAAYLHQQQEAEIEAAIQAGRDKAAAQAKLDEATKPAPPPPWSLVPSSNAVFEACRDAWAQQAVPKPGWALATWTCARTASGVDVTVEWASDEGRAKDAPGMLQPDGKKSSEFRSIPVQWVVEAQQAATSGHEVVELLSADAAVRAARDLAQRFGAELTIVMPQPPKEVAGAEKQALPPYVEITSTPVLPMAPWLGFGSAFDAIPGQRASSIKLDLTKDSWEIVCQVFASRAPSMGVK